jgi:L-lactate dehydrogenase complex protein LldG
VTDRAAFLARIRERLGGAERLDAPVPGDWTVEIQDPVERFALELKAAGGSFHSSASGRAAHVMGTILEARPEPVVVVARDEFVPDDIEASVVTAGGKVRWWPKAGRDETAVADVGVTGALWAVAETGTVVVSAAPPGGRAPSLLPSVHVVFVGEARLLATVRELFVHIEEMDTFPSNLVLITGPSKSADIGNELALGVHGPGELHVVLVES